MTIHVDPTRFHKSEDSNASPYRYGAPFKTGEQEALVIVCEEHRRPGSDRATSIRFVLGTDGPEEAKVRHDHYVSLAQDALERLENVLDVFAPRLKVDGGPFYPKALEGTRVVVHLESEETAAYGRRPALVRFVRLAEPTPMLRPGL